MGFYEQRVLPRIVDVACGSKRMAPLRTQLCAPLTGEVLEVGFGSGTNLPFLPLTVTTFYAVDPSEGGRRLAAKRLAASSTEVRFVGLDGQRLGLDDRSVDHVLCAFTLCTIPDPTLALAEVRRVLRPGGSFHFLEHGRHPKPGVEAWQRRLNPIQRRLFGGCHLDRARRSCAKRPGCRSTRSRRPRAKARRSSPCSITATPAGLGNNRLWAAENCRSGHRQVDVHRR